MADPYEVSFMEFGEVVTASCAFKPFIGEEYFMCTVLRIGYYDCPYFIHEESGGIHEQ